jgi:copper chaperone CopZ
MKKQKYNSKGAVITGVVAAIAASSCCMPPVIAAIAGVGGASTSLAWAEPFRPYLIGLAVVSIGYAWYNHLKRIKKGDCCEIEKPKIYQTKEFLIGMTFFAAISITLPYYSSAIFPENKKEVVVKGSSNNKKITTTIEGMTCDACQNHVNHAVNELPGIISSNTSYDNGVAVVEFDKTVVTGNEIMDAINSTGYMVSNTDVE